MRKLLLGLGSIAAVAAPVSAVVACGWNKMEVKDLSAKSTLKEAVFGTTVEAQNDLINVHYEEANLLDKKVAIEVKAAADLKAAVAKIDADAKKVTPATTDAAKAAQTAAVQTAKATVTTAAATAKATRLTETKTELKALIAKDSKIDANKTKLNADVESAADVTAFSKAVKAAIPTTDVIKTTLGIPTANVAVKGLKVLSLSFDSKTKVLVIIAKYIDGVKVIALSHEVKMTFA